MIISEKLNFVFFLFLNSKVSKQIQTVAESTHIADKYLW